PTSRRNSARRRGAFLATNEDAAPPAPWSVGRLVALGRIARQLGTDARIGIGADVAAAGAVDIDCRIDRTPVIEAGVWPLCIGFARSDVAVGLIGRGRIRAVALLLVQIRILVLGERRRREERRERRRGGQELHGTSPLVANQRFASPCLSHGVCNTNSPLWFQRNSHLCGIFTERVGRHLSRCVIQFSQLRALYAARYLVLYALYAKGPG